MTIIKLNIKQLKKLLVVGMVFSAVLLVAPVSSNAAGAPDSTLKIVSNTTGVDTTFNYQGNIPATDVTTSGGSGSSSSIAINSGTLYIFSQTNALLPFPTVSCTGATATVINATVTFQLQAASDVVCTFSYADPNPTTTITTTPTTTAPAVQGTSVSTPPSVAVQGTSVSGLPVTGYQSEFLAITALILLSTGALFIVAAKKQSAKTANIA